MKNKISPARALAALTSGWSSPDAGFSGSEVVAGIGRQNSNGLCRCHAAFPSGSQSPCKLPAKDDVDPAASAAVERMRKVVFQQQHAVGLKMTGPVPAGFDQAAMIRGTLTK